MKFQLLIFSLAALFLTELSNILPTKQAKSFPIAQGNIRFVCSQSYDSINKKYVPATLAWNPQHKKPIVIWQNEDFSESGFNPQTRCEEVSPRFQEAYDNGSLKYLTYGTMNEQPVICTARFLGEDCDTLIITLRHQDNTEQTLQQLSDILLGYADAPLEQSSDDLVKVDNNRIYIEVNVENFLSQP
ncbi:conserved hypothetical protein [Hyella patelloides LEGE 07179]|uniref:Uncharacterized protein n=1 Tax=Hyella patelloides LEGE 07179 TaxID=945734 RepID=A0A563VNY8_9CYAN|nr:COP23 domain-containing protein [Hyella patelloides]VEP13131.1 conserved hypothetical protein [Hyella patelloides LEGE 07179]